MSYLNRGQRIRFEDMIAERARLFWEIGPRHLIRPQRLLCAKILWTNPGSKLALPKFIWVDLLDKYISLLKFPKVKLILNKHISKLAKLQSVRNSIAQE